jgi:bifunctional DNA-binding transcriptional regulator/antitoxin component of YhaV-PrlF toxin-antitoxin module
MKDVLHKKFKLSSSGSGSKSWRLNIPSKYVDDMKLKDGDTIIITYDWEKKSLEVKRLEEEKE